jgi:hypothetical protein
MARARHRKGAREATRHPPVRIAGRTWTVVTADLRATRRGDARGSSREEEKGEEDEGEGALRAPKSGRLSAPSGGAARARAAGPLPTARAVCMIARGRVGAGGGGGKRGSRFFLRPSLKKKRLSAGLEGATNNETTDAEFVGCVCVQEELYTWMCLCVCV